MAKMKLIAPPERVIITEKKTNIEELLAELRNKLHGYLLVCKHCKEFQINCWKILTKLEKEAKKLNDDRQIH